MTTRTAAIAALSAGLFATLTLLPAGTAAGTTTAGTDAASPEMLAVMQRDLKINAEQARIRLAKEDAAAPAAERLRDDLGTGYAGAWLDPVDQRLVVAVTEAAGAGRVRAAGAEPRLVPRSAVQLETTKTMLDRTARPATTVSTWYVDVVTNSVVVRADPAALPAAYRFVAASGADPTAIRVEPSTERPTPVYDVRGGDAYNSSGSGCSVGFSVTGGFVTAGHCSDTGDTTMGYNNVNQGVVRAAVFPGRDMGWVQVNSNWTPRPWVNNYSGTNLRVAGFREALVNSSVCRSGRTTGWRCGTIEARNVTANYDDGEVIGLTRTTACTDNGDSGGSFITAKQAQGVTSGKIDGGCGGGKSLFQPVRPILESFGLTLVRAPGTITGMGCEYGGNVLYSCHVTYNPGTVQIRWKVNGVAKPAWDNKTSVAGGCGLGTRVGVQVTLYHADGTDAASRSFLCGGEPQ